MMPLHDNPTAKSRSSVAAPVEIRAMALAAATLGMIVLGASIPHLHRAPVPVAAAPAPATQFFSASAPVRPGSRPARTRRALWHQIGLASWYGPRFQGRQTANGEIFDMNDLTCAHRFLPLGTWVKVTNLHTRRWIVVRVNDRGPAPETRIADLSSQAARMLGMHARGVTRVRLDVIDLRQAVEVARLDKLRLARLAAEANQPDFDAAAAAAQP